MPENKKQNRPKNNSENIIQDEVIEKLEEKTEPEIKEIVEEKPKAKPKQESKPKTEKKGVIVKLNFINKGYSVNVELPFIEKPEFIWKVQNKDYAILELTVKDKQINPVPVYIKEIENEQTQQSFYMKYVQILEAK